MDQKIAILLKSVSVQPQDTSPLLIQINDGCEPCTSQPFFPGSALSEAFLLTDSPAKKVTLLSARREVLAQGALGRLLAGDQTSKQLTMTLAGKLKAVLKLEVNFVKVRSESTRSTGSFQNAGQATGTRAVALRDIVLEFTKLKVQDQYHFKENRRLLRELELKSRTIQELVAQNSRLEASHQQSCRIAHLVCRHFGLVVDQAGVQQKIFVSLSNLRSEAFQGRLGASKIQNLTKQANRMRIDLAQAERVICRLQLGQKLQNYNVDVPGLMSRIKQLEEEAASLEEELNQSEDNYLQLQEDYKTYEEEVFVEFEEVFKTSQTLQQNNQVLKKEVQHLREGLQKRVADVQRVYDFVNGLLGDIARLSEAHGKKSGQQQIVSAILKIKERVRKNYAEVRVLGDELGVELASAAACLADLNAEQEQSMRVGQLTRKCGELQAELGQARNSILELQVRLHESYRLHGGSLD